MYNIYTLSLLKQKPTIMDNIKALATEWWRSKDLLQRTHLRKKYKKGVDYKYYTHTSIQDIMDMYKAEHASIKYNLDVSVSPVFKEKDKLLREFKEECNKAIMGACMDKTPMIEESRFALSTDTYEIPTYVLARVTGKSVEIILNKSIHDKVSFEEEVSNLQKYFNAKLIK